MVKALSNSENIGFDIQPLRDFFPKLQLALTSPEVSTDGILDLIKQFCTDFRQATIGSSENLDDFKIAKANSLANLFNSYFYEAAGELIIKGSKLEDILDVARVRFVERMEPGQT